jgi:type IV pilus assembly protein PilZ
MVEKRGSHRSPLDVAVEISTKAGAAIVARARDISVGGIFVDTDEPLPFGSDVLVRVVLPSSKDPFVLPAVVRWTRVGGMGLQFGLLGARETHAITEIVRKAGV